MNHLEIGLVATAFALGFRHGFDWDHLAALSDIAASQQERRRAMALATLYALGHAAVAFAIGGAVIVAATHLPSAVGDAMERVVGATLVALGAMVIVSRLRGRDARMPSRGMLLLAGLQRLRRRRRAPVVVIEHEHDHPVGEPHDEAHADAPTPAAVRAGVHTATRTHRHRHRHVVPMPDDPLPAYGGRVTLGIGMIHGIGFETPTQALVFVTAAGAGSRVAGLLVLVCFLVGLFAANTAVAVTTAVGLSGARSRGRVYAAASLLAAVASLAVGLLYLLGRGDVLPG